MGSFHYSFQKLGFECVLASDIAPSAKSNYEQNFGKRVLDDICDIDPRTVAPYDILCAGFPCQPFSQAGLHKGFADSRGTMFSQVMKFVRANVPKVIVLENVAALLTHDNGNSFSTIQQDLRDAGYTVLHKVLTCSDYGIPQMRKRLFIVGFKGDATVRMHDLDRFFELTEFERKTTLKEYLAKNFEKDTAYTIRCGGKRSPIEGRHNWDGYWVDGKEYRLTIEDALKLQGFDFSYHLTGTPKEQWTLLGNTIPTIFTKIIGEQIVKHVALVEHGDDDAPADPPCGHTRAGSGKATTAQV